MTLPSQAEARRQAQANADHLGAPTVYWQTRFRPPQWRVEPLHHFSALLREALATHGESTAWNHHHLRLVRPTNHHD